MIDKRVSLVLFLLAFLCYSYFLPGGRDANANSRLALIASIVEYHELNIDPYHHITIDKALYNGHYYSDKAIGTAVLGVPVYAAYRELLGFDHLPLSDNKRPSVYPLYTLIVTIVALPSAVLSVLLYQLMRLLGGSRLWALLLSLFYSFGTLAFPFSTVFFGHQVAAAFAFAALFVLVAARLRTSSDPSSAWLLLTAGVLASLAVLMEYQVVLIAAFLFLYAVTFVRLKRRLALYVLGGLPGAALLFTYNWYTLGSPFSLSYSYVSNPSFVEMQTGLFGITQPSWSSFVEITLGPRGLLRQSVFLWLLPLGIWQMGRTAQWRRECAVCVCIGLAFIIWNSGYYLPLGGDTPGARFLVPILPFLIVPLVFLERLPRSSYMLLATRSFLLLTGVWSIGLHFLMSVIGPLAPGPDEIADPVREHWLVLFADKDFRMNLGMLLFGLRGVESLALLAVVFVMGLAAFVFLSRIHGCRSARITR